MRSLTFAEFRRWKVLALLWAMSAWSGHKVTILEFQVLEFLGHRKEQVGPFLLIHVVGTGAWAQLAFHLLDLEVGAHCLAWALYNSGRWFVGASAWHIELRVLGLHLSAHCITGLLLFVSE